MSEVIATRIKNVLPNIVHHIIKLVMLKIDALAKQYDPFSMQWT